MDDGMYHAPRELRQRPAQQILRRLVHVDHAALGTEREDARGHAVGCGAESHAQTPAAPRRRSRAGPRRSRAPVDRPILGIRRCNPPPRTHGRCPRSGQTGAMRRSRQRCVPRRRARQIFIRPRHRLSRWASATRLSALLGWDLPPRSEKSTRPTKRRNTIGLSEAGARPTLPIQRVSAPRHGFS